MAEQAQTLEEMVAIYIKIRNAIRDKEEQHEAEINKIKEQLDLVSGTILDICNEQNVDSLRTPAGTVSRRISTRYWTTDWDSFKEFATEHNALDLFEKRISQGNMRQFLEENPDLYPAGLQADRKYVIQVRKPTSR